MHEVKRYRLALSDSEFHLEAEGGDIVLLRGDAGSGKSVWLKRMAGLMDVPETMVLTLGDGMTVVRMLFDRWPCVWLGGTVEEELIFGLEELPTVQQLHDVLLLWGLSEVSLDDDTEHLNRLQSLRLSLAAITLAKPALVLMDNPSAALSEHVAKSLSEDIAVWSKDSNTIVVVASNRWQDWGSVVTKTWCVSSPDQLPKRLNIKS